MDDESNHVPEVLTSSQLHALFDILSHHETYREVRSFREPETISHYGHPFTLRNTKASWTASHATDSSAPLFAGVFRSIVLTIPGIRDLPGEFWNVRLQGILEKFAEVGLSESYDKCTVSTRKTLATAASAIHGVVSRGVLGGVAKGPRRDLHGHYERSKAEDLEKAWEDVVHELLYGDLIDELFAFATETENLEEHSPAVHAAADYIILHLASLIHHVVVLSPDGPYIIRLLEGVHKLLPYTMIKKILRIGNAATMVQGMMRLLLAKVSVGALSNWVGLTQNAKDGMNLLQRIIWLVLSWDSFDHRKITERIEKETGGDSPPQECLDALKRYAARPREEHEFIRNLSMENSTSMVATILGFTNPDFLSALSEAQHSRCHQYFAELIITRDLEEIINILCRQTPDLFTQALKDIVATFDPIIREVHEHIDLREYVSATESFLTDFINLSKGTPATSSRLSSFAAAFRKSDTVKARTPSVEDYVDLLRRNKHIIYRWVHQVAARCPTIRDEFHAWAKESAKVFQRATKEASSSPINPENEHEGAGALSNGLQNLWLSLPPDTRSNILPSIDAHAKYLAELKQLSRARMQRILDNIHSISPTPSPVNSQFSATVSCSHPSLSESPQTSTPLSGSPCDTSTSYTSSHTFPVSRSNSPLRLTSTGSHTGPGMYLSRWENLLNTTPIGPATARGPIRSGREVRPKPVVGDVWEMAGEPKPPDVEKVVVALEEGFRRLVGSKMKGRGDLGLKT